jgi:hypothetical protein
MAKVKLTPQDVENIVDLLTKWKGKLTWGQLVDKVTAMLGRSYTRQALNDHQQVKRAFQVAKDRVRSRGPKSKNVDAADLPPELAAALQRIENQRAEIATLKAERNALLEKFATWLYNARNRSLTEDDLNRPLPPIERHRSDRK